MPPNAMLSNRLSPKDKREAKRNDYMEADPSHVLGEGMLEAYLGVDLDGLGLEEEADAPFVSSQCGPYQSCVSVLWQMQHTRRHRVPEHARSVGEHAGVRRAPCDEDACAKLGGAAGWRRSQRGRARYSELWGHGAVSGERGGESSRGGEDAGAHARHMRRRTASGLCQLTFPPRPISRVSSASSPSCAALYSFSALEGPNQPMCSARCQRRARVGRRAP
jgi:hypothetical protein